MIDQVRPNDLSAWIQAQPGAAVVLDVREPWEVALAAIPPGHGDAVFVPMMQILLLSAKELKSTMPKPLLSFITTRRKINFMQLMASER